MIWRALLLAALPTVATADLGIPNQCRAFVTIQHEGCWLTKVWTCPGEPEGSRWLGEVVSNTDEYHFTRHFDPDGKELSVRSVVLSRPSEVAPRWSDPMSLSNLVSTGEETEQGHLEFNGEWRPQSTVYKLTGQTRRVDGVSFKVVDFSRRVAGPDGGTSTLVGTMLYNSDINVLVQEATDLGGYEQNTPIVDIIHPGQPGFDAAVPLYGCD